jgi:hypothetical protein
MKHLLFFSTLLAFAAAHVARAGEPTAFELVKRGDPYVGMQSKDKVLQIRSEKSVASLTPNIWHVVYYDPDAPLKQVDVKFGAGKEMNVSRGWRPFQLPAKESDVLERSKLRVDSDKALKLATEQPLLKGLTIKASKLTLDHSDAGPVWKVQLWAAKLKNPEKEADIGMVVLSATDGSVVKNDLHPNKAN